MSFIWLYFCVSCFVFGLCFGRIKNVPDFFEAVMYAVFWPVPLALVIIGKVNE